MPLPPVVFYVVLYFLPVEWLDARHAVPADSDTMVWISVLAEKQHMLNVLNSMVGNNQH